MKNKFLLLPLFFLFILFSHSGFSQDINDPRWNVDPRTMVNLSGDYVPLPIVETDIVQFSTEPQSTITPIGIMVTYPNIRVHPGNAWSQSECPIVSSPINRNILFGSSNAYTFSTGTINSGVYVSLDGGATWTGAETLGAGSANNQRGDPGPTISRFGTFLFTHLTSNTNFGGVTGMGANRSIDNGATWSNTFQVVADGGADKNLTASDDHPASPFYGNSYFAWTSFSTSPAHGRASRTINDGVSWTAPIIINTTPAGHNAQGHDVATGPNGDVYIVWTAGVNFSPFTEDFVGFAKSVNGGVSYTATENIFNVNGSRSGSYNGWGIRTNGFPRIAVDKTGGARHGWIYIVSSEVNNAPSGTDADVVFHRSSNGGTTWSSGIRVNQDALNNGKVQFFPAICVDQNGGINVVYYDNRLFPSVGDSCSVYISRSLDGGSTWADVKISDHNFRPKQMSPFGGGYMGDYIGIAPSIGKVVAIWMDDKANSVAIPNAWTGALDISNLSPATCQDFSSLTFPPPSYSLEFTGTQYWARFAPSAFGAGTGSARFNSWTAPAGVIQSLIYDFVAVGAGNYVSFDEAYAPWSGGNVDSLIVESSINGGTSYTVQARLWGGLGAQAGPLNTVFVGGGQFVPTASQWASKIYSLPAGTNRVRLRAYSGFGNDIWVDNVCVKALSSPVANTLCAMAEGFYRPTPSPNVIQDTIRVYLHRTDFPNVKVDSSISFSSTFGCFNSLFPAADNGTYFMVFKHRNAIETWTDSNLIVYTRGTSMFLDLINNNPAVYGDNQKLVDPGFGFYGMFSGDCNDDHIVDAVDLVIIYNDALIFAGGYIISDVNGDSFADASDIVIAYNNAINFVQRAAPVGAPPTPSPIIVETDSNPVFSSASDMQKWELTQKIMKENEHQMKSSTNKEINESEVYKMMKKIIEENSKKVVKQPFENNLNSNSSLEDNYKGNGVMRGN